MRMRIQAFTLCLFFIGLLAASSAFGAQRPSIAPQDAAKAYSGNPNSMIYHNSGCRYFTCKACVLRFASPDEARQRGYRACKKCSG